MVTQILVNIGSGNGLLPDDTSITWTNIIVCMDQWRLSKANFARYTPAINHENQLHFAKIKFLSNLPGANELSTAMKYDIQQQNNILPKSDSVTSLTGTINNSNKHGDATVAEKYGGWEGTS